MAEQQERTNGHLHDMDVVPGRELVCEGCPLRIMTADDGVVSYDCVEDVCILTQDAEEE